MSDFINNQSAVTRRPFGRIDGVSDYILLLMRDELSDEVERIAPELRPIAAARNGLKAIEEEIARRGFE